MTKYWVMVCIYTFISLIACETSPEDVVPDDDDPILIDDTPDDQLDDLDMNEVSKLLKLENATSISGSIPASSNLADLMIDKDTIFLVGGYKNRIQILSPKSFGAGISTFIQVKGSDEYFDLVPPEEEIADTIFSFYLEIDPGDLELPLTFTLLIAPHKNGIPIDGFEKKVVVEEKSEPVCNPSMPAENWFWLWTTINGNIFSVPGVPIDQIGEVKGCCLDGKSIDCFGVPESDWIGMAYENHILTNLEYLSFKADGSMIGQLVVQTKNIDPSESNFCSNSPAYIRNIKYNAFWGDYTYNSSSNKLSFTSIEAQTTEVYLPEYDMTVTEYDSYYISRFFEYEIISCHFMLERSNMEGTIRERLFERQFGAGVDSDDEYKFIWYD